jgi:hypothetical protein
MVSITVSIQVVFLPYSALARLGGSHGMSRYSSNLPVSRDLAWQPDKREVGSSTLPRPTPQDEAPQACMLAGLRPSRRDAIIADL